MKKQLLVKRKHRYTHEADVMYKGVCEQTRKDDCIKLHYQENNKDVALNVEVFAYHDHMILKYHGETQSELRFCAQEKTIGTICSAYGTIEIMINTYTYIRKDTVISLEYDILSGDEVSDGYRILWNIRGGVV